MEIIQATEQSLVDILFLMRQCIKDMNANGHKQWNESNPSPESLREDIASGSIYLFLDRGMAKGMIKLTEESPEEYDQIDWKGNADKVLYIKWFAVHPVWQDSEIGAELLSFAEKNAKDNGYTSLRLDVLDSYPIGEDFIKAKQFDLAGNFHSDFQKKPFACFEKNL